MLNTDNTVKELKSCYERLAAVSRAESIGKSAFGRDIYLFRFGENPKTVIFGGIHAREWITVLLLTELATGERTEYGFDLVPCLNPDGMCLCLGGAGTAPEKAGDFLVRVNGGEDFSQWKANGRAVDLNVNFDADWGEGLKNVTDPAPSDYIGVRPHSEPEVAAAVKLLENSYALAVSFHSLGEEIYWGYEHNFMHYREARAYADYLGYKLKRSENSTGGLKDYYALNYAGLGLTVEVGSDEYAHPYPVEKINTLIEKHRGGLNLLTRIGEKINAGLHEGSAKGGKKGIS